MELTASTKKKRGKLLVLAAILFTIFPVISHPCQRVRATSTSILINEVLYDPTGSDLGNEWLEIKNISDKTINLEDWSIQVAGSTFSTKLTLPEYHINPEEIVLIGEENIANADITVPKISMQNGGSETDGVRILDDEGNIIDTLLYDDPNNNELPDDTGSTGESFAPDVSSGRSLSRISETDTDESESDFVETTVPTPGEENLIPPTALISIEEHPYLLEEIPLDGTQSTDPDGSIVSWAWKITDMNDETVTTTGEKVVHTFQQEGTHIIELIVTDDDNLSTLDELSIDIEQDPENPIITPIDEAKGLETGTKITITAEVTAPVPCLYEKETYAQDKTAGIRIKIPPEIDLDFGKSYQITGTLGSTYGEERLTVSHVKKLSKKMTIKPKTIEPEAITGKITGTLIITEAKIAKSQGNYLYLESTASDNLIRVYFSKYTELEKPDNAKGKYLTVSGIVSRYGTNDNGSPKLRVMPRFQSDIELNETPQFLAKTGTPTLHVHTTLIMTSLLILVFKHTTFNKIPRN